MGLWGPVWGYVRAGEGYGYRGRYHHGPQGRDPGSRRRDPLRRKYQANFVGKTIFEGDKFVSVKLRKGGAKDPAHEVDAISGGTKTSDGVTAMLYNSLENYLPLLGGTSVRPRRS
ncbi:MAG: FMN-binding protein, partial [Alistipes shahii]